MLKGRAHIDPAKFASLSFNKLLDLSNHTTILNICRHSIAAYGIFATRHASLKADFSEQHISTKHICCPTPADNPVRIDRSRDCKSPNGTSCSTYPRALPCFQKSLEGRNFVKISLQFAMPAQCLSSISPLCILPRNQLSRISTCLDFLATSTAKSNCSADSESLSIKTFAHSV